MTRVGDLAELLERERAALDAFYRAFESKRSDHAP